MKYKTSGSKTEAAVQQQVVWLIWFKRQLPAGSQGGRQPEAQRQRAQGEPQAAAELQHEQRHAAVPLARLLFSLLPSCACRRRRRCCT